MKYISRLTSTSHSNELIKQSSIYPTALTTNHAFHGSLCEVEKLSLLVYLGRSGGDDRLVAASRRRGRSVSGSVSSGRGRRAAGRSGRRWAAGQQAGQVDLLRPQIGTRHISGLGDGGHQQGAQQHCHHEHHGHPLRTRHLAATKLASS